MAAGRAAVVVSGIVAAIIAANYLARGVGMKQASAWSLSSEGIEAIKGHEGWRASVYLDSAGLQTIGYGHLIKPGEKFSTITKTQGEALLRADLATAEAAVKKFVLVPISQGMYDALVSFTFNLGGGNLSQSTLLKKLNAGAYLEAAAEFLRWNKAAGVEVDGLTARRAAESNAFIKGLSA